MDRRLDGFFFRVERNGKWENICFSDLTEEEQRRIIEHKDKFWLQELCIGLAKTIKSIGDDIDIYRESGEDYEDDICES